MVQEYGLDAHAWQFIHIAIGPPPPRTPPYSPGKALPRAASPADRSRSCFVGESGGWPAWRDASRAGGEAEISLLALPPSARFPSSSSVVKRVRERNHRNSPQRDAPRSRRQRCPASSSRRLRGAGSPLPEVRWLRSFLASPPANFCGASGTGAARRWRLVPKVGRLSENSGEESLRENATHRIDRHEVFLRREWLESGRFSRLVVRIGSFRTVSGLWERNHRGKAVLWR